MVRDDSERRSEFWLGLHCPAEAFLRGVNKRRKEIGLVIGNLFLQDGGEAFEARAGVDRGLWQRLDFA